MSDLEIVFESFFSVSSYFYMFIVILFFVILYLSKRYRKTARANFRIYYTVMIVFLLLQEFALFQNITIRKTVGNTMREKTYNIVTGEINSFHAMPKSGHDLERFDVNEIHFEIAYTGNYPNSKTLFYTLTKNRNGPIQRNGQKVKIYYIEYLGENKIIKMWVDKETDKNTTKKTSG